MKKSILKHLSVFLILAGLVVPLANAQQPDKHMLWKIEKGGELQGYMIGSVHLMKPGIYPLDDVYQQAYKKADVVVFEVNMDSMKAQAMMLVRKMAIYPQSKSIKGDLSKNTYSLLKTKLNKLNLPVNRFSRIEPWFVAMSISSAQITRAGYSPKAGIDKHFFSLATKDGKNIAALETAKYQLNIFDDLSPELQERYLKYTLKNSGQIVKNIDKMVKAWKHGNAQKIQEMIQGEMKKKFPELYHTILVERNKNWIPQITNRLKSGNLPLIVVGAAHMVGQKGLVSLLEQQGYEVEQM